MKMKMNIIGSGLLVAFLMLGLKHVGRKRPLARFVSTSWDMKRMGVKTFQRQATHTEALMTEYYGMNFL